MKFIYFHQHFSTPKGAAGIRSYEMARKLVQRGHSVVMVCGSYSGGHTGLEDEFKKGMRRGIVDGIEIIEFDLSYANTDGFIKRTLIFLSFALKSVRVALVEKYDLVFATTTPLTAAIPGIFAKWFRRKPFIFEVRDLWPELPREMGVITNPFILWGMGRLEWLAYKNADKLIAFSPGIKKGIMRLGILENNIKLIPNGCDLEIFSNTEIESWRPDDVETSDFMAVFTGTHGKANGLGNLIKVAEILKSKKRMDIKLVLIGQGKEKNFLVETAKKLKLDNLIFCEPVEKKKLAGLLSSADIGMQLLANIPAFYYGTSPNKFFDYLASGLPVITNYPGWVADMISEHQCGVVVEPDDAEGFAKAVIQLADNRNVLGGMGEAAKNLAVKDFSRDELSTKFVDWLEEGVPTND